MRHLSKPLFFFFCRSFQERGPPLRQTCNYTKCKFCIFGGSKKGANTRILGVLASDLGICLRIRRFSRLSDQRRRHAFVCVSFRLVESFFQGPSRRPPLPRLQKRVPRETLERPLNPFVQEARLRPCGSFCAYASGHGAFLRCRAKGEPWTLRG